MTFIRKAGYWTAGVIAIGLLGSGAARSEGKFDLSPEQPNRLRVEKIAKRVEEIRNFKFVKDGVLTIGISTSGHLPLHDNASDSKTVIGYDVDLAQIIADSLGLQLELVSVAWADWPLGLSSGKFDAVISNVTVTEERKEKFDFSTYRKDELGFYVKSDSEIGEIKSPKDIAGLKVITDAGTNQEKILLEWDRQNVAAGLKAVEVQYYDDDAVKDLAVQSGRADAVFSVNATQAYSAGINGKTKLVGTVSGGWPITAEIAVTTRKGSGLAQPLTDVLNDLIASGAYQKVLETWNLGPEAITEAKTNPQGLPKSGS
ncbi:MULTISPECIES: ABC transporter substrate-binding protein [Brucella]|jgi:polar amino acid transport system substrate-binding protein|uniref:ABC transporter substrate-binding protein n=1 Tax=Brucella anthropi TaxID=529 RepID=A0A011UB97_BRUAN|nr:ABC transporter substrate-binding protein [Brucella anthropi]QTN04208.1 transporter substrate-binding domain-containing protein [Ochrobactrum sp. EEELCW01]EXL03361.1 ABC transporter substrate-binding protein [Brucella anthropi]KAB2736413.1 ABC transporter substrate-binding protein [Brucella anthropi]KAB2770054.1 ABC transporter substrate-binding protein [Brucella anthropi]KAB2796201.1 ABC transporter substrate-binding protein [Brucella anthropi]